MNLGKLEARLKALEASRPKVCKPYKVHYLDEGDPDPELDPAFDHIYVVHEGCGGVERFPDAKLCSPLGETTSEPMFSTDEDVKTKPVNKPATVAEPVKPERSLSLVPVDPIPGTRGYYLRWGTKWPLNSD